MHNIVNPREYWISEFMSDPIPTFQPALTDRQDERSHQWTLTENVGYFEQIEANDNAETVRDLNESQQINQFFNNLVSETDNV